MPPEPISSTILWPDRRSGRAATGSTARSISAKCGQLRSQVSEDCGLSVPKEPFFRAAVEQISQRFGEEFLAIIVHYGSPAWQIVRKRFTARYTNSATASRDLPRRSAISAVEIPSILAMRIACR